MLTVTTPATNTRLTTVQAVRDAFGITSGALSDAGVEALIDRASAAVVSYCNRPLAKETVKQVERPELLSWRRRIPLQRWPAANVAVRENGTALVADASFALDPDGWILSRLNGAYEVAWPRVLIEITYDAGYVLPDDDGTRDLPGDVEQAAILLVGDMWQTQSRQEAGVVKRERVEGVGEVEYFMPGTASKLSNPVAQMLLDPYVRVTL